MSVIKLGNTDFLGHVDTFLTFKISDIHATVMYRILYKIVFRIRLRLKGLVNGNAIKDKGQKTTSVANAKFSVANAKFSVANAKFRLCGFQAKRSILRRFFTIFYMAVSESRRQIPLVRCEGMSFRTPDQRQPTATSFPGLIRMRNLSSGFVVQAVV
jgi:hypothetical protein